MLAPYYLEGSTDPSSWTAAQQHPAPWGEVGSGKLAIAAPAAALRAVPDPAAVTAYWDQVR